MDRYLVLLIGNIASGKSTIAKKFDKAGYLVVSSDSIRYMLHPNEYKFDIDEEYIVNQTKKSCVQTAMELGFNIIVDDAGNSLKTKREWIVSLAKEKCYKLIAITMPFVSKSTAVKRRLKDNHGKYDKARWEEVYDMFLRHQRREAASE